MKNKNKKFKYLIFTFLMFFSFLFLVNENVDADEWIEVNGSSSFKFFEKARATYINKQNNFEVVIEYVDLDYIYNFHSPTKVNFSFEVLFNGKKVYDVTERLLWFDTTHYYTYHIDPNKSSTTDFFIHLASGGYSTTPNNFELFFPSIISVDEEDVYMYKKEGKSTLELVKAEIVPYSFSSATKTELCTYKVDMKNFGADNPSDKVSSYTPASMLNIVVGSNGVIEVEIIGKIGNGNLSSETIPLHEYENNVAENAQLLYKKDCPLYVSLNPGKTELYLHGAGYEGVSKKAYNWKAKDYVKYETFYHEIEQLKDAFNNLLIRINNEGFCYSNFDRGKYHNYVMEHRRFETRLDLLKYKSNLSEQQKNTVEEYQNQSDQVLEKLSIVNDCLNERNIISDEEHEQYNDWMEESRVRIRDSIEGVSQKFKSDRSNLRCDAIFNTEATNFIKTAYFFVQVGAIVLTIILGILDFSKATLSSDDDAIKKAFNSFIKRIIACGILIVLPMLITLLLNIVSIPAITNTNPFCI